MNRFSTDRRFDRIFTEEMFEHMRNWDPLLRRINRSDQADLWFQR